MDGLGKYKEECGGPFLAVITDLNKKISALEKQVAANNRVADLVLIEVKALFASTLAKIQLSPEISVAKVQHSFESKTKNDLSKSNQNGQDDQNVQEARRLVLQI